MNDRKKAVRVLAKLESGCICGEDMEWIVRGMKTLKAKRELKQRHGGLVFAGPQYGAPLYKTGNGIRRLLRGVSLSAVRTYGRYECIVFIKSMPYSLVRTRHTSAVARPEYLFFALSHRLRHFWRWSSVGYRVYDEAMHGVVFALFIIVF